MIKLDAMENPYPLPPDVRAKIAAAVADVPVNRYPDGGRRERQGGAARGVRASRSRSASFSATARTN